jgi:hypothetical protein
MSYWSHYPEQYDQIIHDRLVDEGLASPDDEDVADVVSEFMKRPDSWKLATEAERDHWADKTNEAVARCEGDR